MKGDFDKSSEGRLNYGFGEVVLSVLFFEIMRIRIFDMEK